MSWCDDKSSKVWRIVQTIAGRNTELIVATKSRSAAARAFGCTDSYLKTYGTQTGNAVQMAYALTAPGIVFHRPVSPDGPPWQPMQKDAVTADVMTKVEKKVAHVTAIEAAKAKGLAIWQAYQFGCGARLRLPAFTINVETQTGSKGEASPGYKVSIGDVTLVRRYREQGDAKVAGLALARQLIEKTLAALPEDPLLEE